MALSQISGTTGIANATITSIKLADFAAAVDLNGVELILDADQDTSITADTDDRIDFKIAGAEHISLSNSSGDTIIKPMADGKDIVFQQYDARKILEINDAGFVSLGNGGTGPGELRIYEDTDLGTNYSGFTVGNLTESYSLALPNADGSSGQALTTDGSGVLSFTTVSANTPSSADGQALGSAALEWSDLFLADGGVINLGADQDTTLTHVADTGILLNSTRQLQFGDSGTYIHQSADGVLDLVSDTEIEINATTIDINGNVEISGTLAQVGVATFTARDIHSGGITIANDGTIGSVGDADSIAISSAGVVTMTQIPVLSAGLNVSGGTIAGTLATAAQGNVTSLGTLTALTVDDVAVDGKVITMTGSSGDTFVTTVAANGATSLVTTDAAAAAAHLTITADGTVDINSAGVLTLDSGAAINIEPASGSAILLDGTISIDAGVVTGATSITSTAFVGGLTGNVTGNASGTALTVTQAAQSAITSVGTLTALTVDDVAIDGKVMTMTGSSGDTFVTTVAANGATSLVTTDAAAAAANLTITADGTVGINSTGDMTLDSSTDIILDAGGDNVYITYAGTNYLDIQKDSNDVQLVSRVSDGDMVFRGNDSGSAVTALTLDMSAAGAATFNDSVALTGTTPILTIGDAGAEDFNYI